jgi:glutamate/tyrosine decarboxylase-like PLP-dependent enzyme
MPERAAALDIAHRAASSWLDSLADRPVPPQATTAEVAQRLGADLPDGPSDPAAVVQLLADACTPALTAMPSGRFFGFVIGGTHPAALAADWLVSAWDQNCGLRSLTPAHTAVEDIATTWLVELLGLPAGCAIGYVTGATTANVTGLATGRDAVLRRAGWDVPRDGLSGGPRVRVLVGAERHDTIDLALRYLGLGAPEQVAADDQGRLRVDELQRLLETGPEVPTMVLLQAGNVHSGAFDPLAEAIAVAHRHGAWVHVDGAFGLWAAASPRHRHLVAGHEAADSWATDAHKTLNVPYDCGLLAVRAPEDLRAAMGVEGPYLLLEHAGRLEPSDKVLELSRRGRAFPVWAVLRSLGRSGVADLVDGLCRHATSFAEGLTDLGATVRNDVVFTQVCADFGDDARTDAVIDGLLADGTTWMTGSTWHGRRVLRVAVSNWSTTDDDVARSLEAVRRVLAGIS